jgi:pilus assembly protein CpaF
MCVLAKKNLTLENPFVDGHMAEFRLSLASSEVTQNSHSFCLRRHPKNPWNFQKLIETGWCSQNDFLNLKSIFDLKKNFLIIGGTGSGKTSVVNSFLQLMPEDRRAIVIEDTSEICLSNDVSLKMLTRDDSGQILKSVTTTDLVKKSLRMRPDSLVMGEIRGDEAKDFLMALATGHEGCFGTLHASNPAQALIRLEMLIQIGAPQWNLQAVRRLIQLSLHSLVLTERQHNGQRKLKGIYNITGLEEHGFLLEKVDQIN